MFLARTALAVVLICIFAGVNGQAAGKKSNDESQHLLVSATAADDKDEYEDKDERTDDSLIDNHSFVALIDIVFTDGTKRICTGTIIHEQVVLTAAHCFKTQSEIPPELTASFVVIGTRALFETGYEQYLPIERVVTHPQFKGWTADLSLVYTFAAMTSDKPGTIIPLAGEKTSTHVDTNVTVLSWGYLKNPHEQSTKAYNDNPSSDSSSCNTHSENESDEIKKDTEPRRRPKNNVKRFNTILTPKLPGPKLLRKDPADSNESSDDSNVRKHDSRVVKEKTKSFNLKKYYGNWRRQMGADANKLLVDNFVFVDIQLCQKLVKNAMPGDYDFTKKNDIICYTSTERQISDEDSGAPVLRNNRLVAVTIGATYNEENNIAVGMKMSCYCTWITDNLPKDGKTYKCCKDCCFDTHREVEDSPTKKNLTS